MRKHRSVARVEALDVHGVGRMHLLYAMDVSNGIRAGQPLPARLKVLNWGLNRTTKGDFIVNEKTARMLPDTQLANNWDDVCIDIEHASVPGSPLFKAAAENGKFPELLGRGKPVVVLNDGLYIDQVVWSPHGKRAYEFPDISPAVKQDADGVVVGIHSLAFCTHGATFGLHAYSATSNPNSQQDGITMKNWFLRLLGFGQDATDQQVEQKLDSLADVLKLLGCVKPEALQMLCALKPDVLTALAGLKPDTLTTLSKLSAKDVDDKLKLLSTIGDGQKETLQAALTRLSALETTLATLSTQHTADRRSALLARAARAGKKVPKAYLDKYGDDLETLSALIEDLPVTVPLNQRAVEPSTVQLSTASGQDGETESRVAALFGRTPDALRKACVVVLAVLSLGQAAFAGALTAERSTPRLAIAEFGLVQGSNTLYAGAMTAIDSAGKACPAADASGYTVVGRCEDTSINSYTSYSATRLVSVRRGIFKWLNGGSFTAANIGQICYVADDNTVTTAAAATNDIPAGIIVKVDTDGVWVDCESLSRVLSGSLNALAVTGAGSVGTTFDVGGAATVQGAVTLGSTLVVTGAVTAVSTLGVTGAITGSSTVSATGYKIGAVSGWGGVVTNASTLITNVLYYGGGLVTNVVVNP